VGKPPTGQEEYFPAGACFSMAFLLKLNCNSQPTIAMKAFPTPLCGFAPALALLGALATIAPALAQNVGLNNDGTTAHPSAILDMKATDKGVLVPRLTQAQRDAVATPATGLLVYQTDNTPGFYYYNGTTWVPLATSGWALAGNAATGMDFIGTTTNQPLRFRANNTEQMVLAQRGALELGQQTFGNLFIGLGAGAATNLANANVQGLPSTFLGHLAGAANTTGYANVFLGHRAGGANTTGLGNVFLGHRAGGANITGASNTFLGNAAGLLNTASNNTFVGNEAGRNNSTATANTFIGFQAGLTNTTGSANDFIGYRAGTLNTNGNQNFFLGTLAGANNTTGSFNHFVGNQAGRDNTTSGQNHFAGILAGLSNTSGNQNHFEGHQAGRTNTTGSRNLFIGYDAGAFGNTGNENVFVGYRAGYINTGGANIFIGYLAGEANTTGFNNHFVGYWAGRVNTTGNFNHFSGLLAGRSNTSGSQNVFVGYDAGLSNTTASNNHFFGWQAGRTNDTGANNHFDGFQAGRGNTTGNNNTFIGLQAGLTNQTGSGNVFLGYQAGSALTNPSNQLVIDNSNTATPLISGDFAANRVGLNRVATANTLEVGGEASKLTAGAWAANSDRRIKADIQPVEGGLATLLRVRPVRFRYSAEWLRRNPGIRDRVYYNVIAQEYREVFPDDVKGSGEYLEAGGEEILQVDTYSSQMVTIRAVQELAAEVEALKKENSVLKSKLGEMDGLKTELGQAKAKLGENEKMRAEMDEVKTKLNELYKLLQAAAPGGGK
jgi:hypothetical protein